MKKITYRDIVELTPKEQDCFWDWATRHLHRKAKKRRALAQNQIELGVENDDITRD